MRWLVLPPRRALLYGALLTIVGAGILGALFVLSGAYNVAASVKHFYVTDRLIKLALYRSIDTHSSGIEPPPLDDESMVRLGARHFATGCAPCHAAPGLPQSAVAAGMYPAPPRLAHHVAGWEDRELFWIVRHGLKFTGMPQWPGEGRDEEVWPVVAFLRQLPGMSAEDYAQWVGDAAPTAELSFEAGAAMAQCAGCHGDADAGPVSPLVPALQGQSEAYLVRALEEYADDERQSGMMEALASVLSEEERAMLAQRYAAMAPPAALPEAALDESVDLAAGEEIATQGLREQNVAACLSCHDAERSAQFPRLGGLSAAYIEQQLKLFRDGMRGDTPYGAIMRTVAAQLSDGQIADVAAYLASREAPAGTGAGEAVR